MSNYWFFENKPKNKGLCRDDDMVRFFVKNLFHRQKVMYFHEKLFFGCRNFCGTSKFAPNLRKSKMWLNSAVKCQIIFFLKISPKTKVYAERRYGAFFVKNCFHKQKVMYFYEKLFFGCRNFCGTSKFALNLRKFKMWLNSAVKCQIIFFLKIGPKTKVYAERRYGAFFCKKFVSTDKKWCIFTRNIFWV